MSEPIRRLYRSRVDGLAAGLCAGIADYLRVDPTVVRFAAVALTILTAIVPCILVYLAGWILVPREPLPVHEASPAAQAHGAG